MSKGALIIGGSAAGLQATLDLANSGLAVHLVESSPFLGNGVQGSVPQHRLNARLLEVTKHPNVTVWTDTSVCRTRGEAGSFQVELRQQPRYVSLEKCTACKDCLEVCPVTVPGSDHRAIHLVDGAQPGCAVIYKQGKAPCSNACPGGIHVQGYVALIAAGRFQEAIELIQQAIPFPGICGRICTHPCESECRRAELDSAVSIRLLKRFVADWALQHPPEADHDPLPLPAPDAKRVAIVGAGPAGLTVAQELLCRGHRATLFEGLPVAGGMMAVGIPAYRLPRDVIQREVHRIEQMGAEIRLSTPIGPQGKHTIDDLFQQGYDAVFLGIGAHRSPGLRIPGERLRGVVPGVDLLKAISLSQQTHDPQWQTKILGYLLGGASTRVAIIGGGNTAIDVARSLKRLGVDEVRILYRRTRAEMPALPEEIEEADREGIPVKVLVSPVRILGDEKGRVSALECVRMKLGEVDGSGRRRPVPIPGSEFLLDIDMVVEAIGQTPDLALLGEDHRFAITRQGKFDVDLSSCMTSRPGVFAAGDAISQPMSVIHAIGSAKHAATAIDAYLRGTTVQNTALWARDEVVSRRELLPDELTHKPQVIAPALQVPQRLSNYDEVELGYDAEMAVAEASRCLMCGPCAECLACETVCEPNAIIHDQKERVTQLEVGAIVHANGSGAAERIGRHTEATKHFNGNGRQGIYHVEPGDPLAGSAAAASVMIELFTERQTAPGSVRVLPAQGSTRIGVFVCECNGQISDIVDVASVESAARTWSGVSYTMTLSQSCSPEAADAIYQAVASQNLNRVVLAACSCCAVDQVCYSCTYQRVRCKDNLLGRHFDRASPLFEFVNIREQCAWAHSTDPDVATSSAKAMVAAAVAKTRLSVSRPRVSLPFEKTALVMGSGQAATVCQGALSVQRIQALRLRGLPKRIHQTPNHFTATLGNSTLWNASALILAPRGEEELQEIMSAFDTPGRQPRTQTGWGETDTHRPGIFVCDPAADPIVAGMAAAARTAAWLGHKHPWQAAIASEVDPSRCRGCGDCEQVCEFGAIQLQGEGDGRVAWIDPLICRADGTCAARCPAGAIRTGHPTAEQIEAMLEAILS